MALNVDLHTQCNFDESDDAPEGDKVEPIAPQQLLGMLFAKAPPSGAPLMDDGEDDDEDGEEVCPFDYFCINKVG